MNSDLVYSRIMQNVKDFEFYFWLKFWLEYYTVLFKKI